MSLTVRAAAVRSSPTVTASRSPRSLAPRSGRGRPAPSDRRRRAPPAAAPLPAPPPRRRRRTRAVAAAPASSRSEPDALRSLSSSKSFPLPRPEGAPPQMPPLRIPPPRRARRQPSRRRVRRRPAFGGCRSTCKYSAHHEHQHSDDGGALPLAHRRRGPASSPWDGAGEPRIFCGGDDDVANLQEHADRSQRIRTDHGFGRRLCSRRVGPSTALRPGAMVEDHQRLQRCRGSRVHHGRHARQLEVLRVAARHLSGRSERVSRPRGRRRRTSSITAGATVRLARAGGRTRYSPSIADGVAACGSCVLDSSSEGDSLEGRDRDRHVLRRGRERPPC